MKAGLIPCFLIPVLLLLQACTGSSISDFRARDTSTNSGPNAKIVEATPMSSKGKITDEYVRRGLQLLREGSYDAAQREFGKTLRYDPQNSSLHFLNGLAFHLLAEHSTSDQYEYAQIGYELALKFEPNNWLAAQQLARLSLSRREYRNAQEYFAYALLFRPNDASLLYGLAQSSYYMSDMETALGAVRKADELVPGAPEITSGYAIIAAASGQTETAQRMLATFRQLEPGSTRLSKLEERIEDWKDIHSQFVATPSAGQHAQAGTTTEVARSSALPDSTTGEADQPKMVMIDVVMLRTEENETSNKGINLLENLSLTFEGRFNSQPVEGNLWQVPTKSFIGTLDMPKVSYSLRIFNAGDDRTEALALPTLIALDGKQSTSFAGTTLNVAVTGIQTGSISELAAGISLDVLPIFLSDNAIQLHVIARRTFVEEGAVGSFHEAVRTSKNEVTADVVMNIGETLVLSGLREKQTSSFKSGVPLLRDIPILQYIFSTEKTSDFHKSSLILLTPRRVSPGIYRSSSGRGDESSIDDNPKLKEFRQRYGYLFSLDDNVTHVMRHLDKHAVAAGLRSADLFDRPWWGDPESIDIILKRTASFLYY